jgi:hypothetical protein
MEFLHLIFAFLLGAAVILSGLFLLPKMVDRYLTGKKKTFEIVFRIDYYQQPSLYNKDAKGQLIKSAPITVKIRAATEKDALNLLDDIIRDETKGELVRIKEIKDEPLREA